MGDGKICYDYKRWILIVAIFVTITFIVDIVSESNTTPRYALTNLRFRNPQANTPNDTRYNENTTTKESVEMTSLAGLTQRLKKITRSFVNYKTTNQQVTSAKFAETTEMPGLVSMDRDLSLPPPVPKRPESKEMILNYSQQRDYRTIIAQPEKCRPLGRTTSNMKDSDGRVFLLVAIKSSCGNRDRRNAIRKTWSDEQWVNNHTGVIMRRVFLLGACTNTIMQSELEAENLINGDILQWDFYDSFRNLTLKDCLYLQWFAQNCRDVPFVFKGDDDVFVNLKNIVLFLKDLPQSRRDDLFVGSVLKGSPRILNPSWKYYVSYNLYPDKFYPPYVSGGGFAMSGNVALKLFRASLESRIIPIDDAFLGILLKKIGITPQNDRSFKSWGMRKLDSCRLAKIKTFHKMKPDQMIEAWSQYINLDMNKCAKDSDDVFLTQTRRR